VRVSSAISGVDVNANFKSPIIAGDIKPAIASAFRFGGERMTRTQTDLCLTAGGDGEDVGMSMTVGGGARKSSFFLIVSRNFDRLISAPHPLIERKS